jgi:AraC-like DNA-binding protein
MRSDATVATVLLPAERSRVEAAGQGCYVARHEPSIEEATRNARRGRVDAVFLSVHCCGDAELPRVAQFVREFPHVPTVALISRSDLAVSDRVLKLGASGVSTVVDVTTASGWQRLRDVLREPGSPVVARVMAAFDAEVPDAPSDCRLFFNVLMRRAPMLRTVGELSRTLEVVPTSLMSRFYRARLPSPKIYLAHARLLHAAYLFQSGGLSVSDVSHRLEYSSPQSFGRHLQVLLGITACEFRRRYPFLTAVDRFRASHFTPFRARLRAFHPFGTLPGSHGLAAA